MEVVVAEVAPLSWEVAALAEASVAEVHSVAVGAAAHSVAVEQALAGKKLQ